MSALLPAKHLVPESLHPEALVSKTEASLLVSDDAVRTYLRKQMTSQEISLELDAIHGLAEARLAFGDFSLLGLKPMQGAYTCVDSGTSALSWLHDHERKRLNQLLLALPSPAEEMAAAQERVRQRIESRRQLRTVGLPSTGTSHSGPELSISAGLVHRYCSDQKAHITGESVMPQNLNSAAQSE